MPSVSAAEIYATWPDDRFPHMPARLEAEGLLIFYPHRGNQLHVRCLTCGREAEISGRRLAVDFTAHLAFPTGRFVAALRCSGCRGRRLLAYARRDPGASGFQLNTMDDGQMIFARRLNTWLAEAGTDIWAFTDALGPVPPRHALEEATRLGHGA